MLQQLDTAVFRWVNQGIPALDPFITIFNGGAGFKRLAILAGALVVWKGDRRAKLCLLFLALSLMIGDWVIVGGLKRAVGRQRPYTQLQDVRHITGKGDAGSMPSGHAANSMAIAIVVSFFYPRLRWIMFPFAFMVSLARVYSGVHFPSDVIAGASLSVLYTLGILYGAEALWKWKGPVVAPGWAARVPSLLDPAAKSAAPSTAPTKESGYDFWKLGWYLIGFTVVFRWLYIAAGKIELSEDEAYQWMWSKHLALSYYSKPPLIAYVQWLGTSIWGDRAFGIRFFSPLLAAANAALLLTFLTRLVNARVAFFAVAAACATPIFAAGATLMTIDAISVFCWTLAGVLVWRAVEKDSTFTWAAAGLAICFGLLAKYVALFQWASVLLFLGLAAPRQFRRPGVYLAILISLLGLLPVIIWNQQNNWITLTHLSERSGLDQKWAFTFRFMNDFIWAELGLLNPVFAILMVWAALRFWKSRTPLQTFLFCMGAPMFLGYFLYTLRARVQPNWIAPSILPLFALAAIYWDGRWRQSARWLKPTLQIGFGLGLGLVILLHDTNLTQKIAAVTIPENSDPLVRVRAWSALAKVVEEERAKHPELKFVIGGHYGVTSLMTFYNKETRANPAGNTLVYALATKRPVNQYYFWRKYLHRTGENALFVLRSDQPMPEELKDQFESLEDLGEREVVYRGRVFHRIRLYACKNLRPQVDSTGRL